MLVALKCDLRPADDDDNDEVAFEDPSQPKKEKKHIDYTEGLEVARRIQALRYLGTVLRSLSHQLPWEHTKDDDRMLSKA